MGRLPDAAAARRRLIAGAFAVGALASAWGAPPARAAEDVPEAVVALDAEDPAARDAAKAALLARPDVDDIAVAWLRDGSRRRRLTDTQLGALVDVVGTRGVQLANEGLRALVRDAEKPAALRRKAATTLGTTGSVADVGALADGLADLPDECARALASIGGPSAVSVLRAAAARAPQPVVLAALARAGDDSRLPEVVGLLDDPAQRDGAAELLRWATGRDLPATADAWRRFLVRRDMATRLADPDQDAAQAATVEIADRMRAGGAQGAALADDVAAMVQDEGFPLFARTKAALAIGLSGVRTKNDVLLAACTNGQPGELRWAAANALARVGDLSCAVPIALMLGHDEDHDRIRARRRFGGEGGEFTPVDPQFVRTLHRVGIRGGTKAILDLLQGDYRTGLHREALFALQEASGGNTFDLQPDSSKEQRLEVVAKIRRWWTDGREALTFAPKADDPGWPRFRKDVDGLIELMGGYKVLFQIRAKYGLVVVAEAAAPQIVAALSSDDLHMRMGACEVMEEAAVRIFAAPLAARLAVEENVAGKTKVLTALEACGRKDPATGVAPAADMALPTVRTLVEDRNLDVRIGAARVLGVMGDASDVDRLKSARVETRNALPAFRSASAGSLLVLGDWSAAADLVAELRADDVLRRADAAEALRRGGVDLRGFVPDGPDDAREQAVKAIEADVSDRARR